MKTRLPALLALVAASSAGVAVANHIEGTSCNTRLKCADHRYWPRMTLKDVQKAPEHGGTLKGQPNRSDELLGWHGSDTLYGYGASDVLWADHEGDGQSLTQRDRIYGGDGNDFIYSSRGINTIDAGAGNDAIKIRYGRGTLDCGPGRDIYNVPRKRKGRWKIKNCEKVDHLTEKARGGGLKPLP